MPSAGMSLVLSAWAEIFAFDCLRPAVVGVLWYTCASTWLSRAWFRKTKAASSLRASTMRVSVARKFSVGPERFVEHRSRRKCRSSPSRVTGVR